MDTNLVEVDLQPAPQRIVLRAGTHPHEQCH
jgi:hypothetical protein